MSRSRVFLLLALLTSAAAGAFFFARKSPPPEPPRRLPPRNLYAPSTDEQRVRDRLFELLLPVTIANCRLERFGEANDGGYLLCGNLLSDVQSGYSYGISGYDGWGCEVSGARRIPVHQYDCFDTRKPDCGSGRTIFHAECVGTEKATIEGRPFDTIERQIAANGDAGKRLVVKIDVEGAEWDAFKQTPVDVLDRIDQMAVEFHGVRNARFVAALEKLRETFHVAHLHVNNYSCQPGLDPFPGWAYEVLFVNKRIAVTDGTFARGVPHALDAPNNPAIADCQPLLRRSSGR